MRFDSLVALALKTGAHTVTRYLSPTHVERVTRRLYRCYGKKPRFDKRHTEFVVQSGPPNYRERAFIRACKKAGESFPVRKPQIKYPPA